MKRIFRMRLLALVALLALVVPNAAIATEHEADEPEEEPRFTAVVDAEFDEFLKILLFAINSAEAEEPVDCSVPEDVVLERSEDEETGETDISVVEGDWEVPEGCTVVDVAGPNGQVNHGQVVSNFVHALKALDRSGIDVPFGQLLRQIAGSDLGKKVAADEAEDSDDADDLDDLDEGEDDDEDDDDGNGPPPHANNDKDKAKKPKGNNGKGWGANK